MQKQRAPLAATWISMTLLVTSVGLNALQAKRIRELVEPSSVPRSRIGQPAGLLSGTGLDGQPVALRFGQGDPTVIYYFSPACRWCDQNWDNVRALARAGKGRFHFVAVASETGLGAFARARSLDFDIIEGISTEMKRAFGLTATPQTVVISSQGQLSHEWLGAFEGRRKRAVESYFDITLPGLAPPADER